MKKLIIIFFLTNTNPIGSETIQMKNLNTDTQIKTFSDVFKTLIEMNCTYPIESLAQGILENGWQLHSGNNIFGMNHPTKRPTTSIGADKYGKAIYKTKRDAIIDLLLWQQNCTEGDTYFEKIVLYKYNLNSFYCKNLQYIINMKDFKEIINTR